MNILGFFSHLFHHERPKAPAKMVHKPQSTKEAADEALKQIFSKNRVPHGR